MLLKSPHAAWRFAKDGQPLTDRAVAERAVRLEPPAVPTGRVNKLT